VFRTSLNGTFQEIFVGQERCVCVCVCNQRRGWKLSFTLCLCNSILGRNTGVYV